ncbi:MAG TPA: hypothetical protein VFO76_00535, partial [Candidatus Kapabacteria bacterium]|nr:hypothetical protein [Candidatus Kapabacteria bacterium]
MRYTVILLLVLISAVALSQTKGWRQLPGPYNGLPTQIEVGSDGTIYVLNSNRANGTNQLYYYTSDKQWHQSKLPNNQYITINGITISSISVGNDGSIYFFTNIATSYGPDGVYRSTDKGLTWAHTASGHYFNKICKSSSGNLYAFKGGPDLPSTIIFRSNDNGLSWDSLTSIELRSGDFLVDNLDQCYFSLVDKNQIGVINYNAKTNIYKAFATNSPSLEYYYPSIAFCKGKLCLRTNTSFFVLKEDETWEKTTSFKSIYSMREKLVSTFSGALYTFTLSDTNPSMYQIVESKDIGRTWHNFNPPIPSYFQRQTDYSDIISFASDSSHNDYFGVSNPFIGASIYSTPSSSQQWEEFGLPSAKIHLLQEIPNKILYVNSYNPSEPYEDKLAKPYFSDNGGMNWTSSIPQITGLPGDTGYYAKTVDGSYFYFYYSRNSSTGHEKTSISFADATTPTSFNLSTSTGYSSLPLASSGSSNNFFALFNGSINLTTDHGVTWEGLNTPNTSTPLSMFNIDSKGTIYIGYAPALYESTDDGVSWTKVLHGIKNAAISAIKFPNSQTILVGTLGDGLWKSTNNGSSWEKWTTQEFDSITAIEMVGNTCYAGTSRGLIKCDLNSTSWHNELFTDEQYPILQLLKTDSGYLYASVPDIGIWKTDPQANSVTSNHSISNDLGLALHGRSDDVSISFTLDKREHVSVALYDILGHKLQTIVEGAFDANEHQIPFSTNSLPNGIY